MKIDGTERWEVAVMGMRTGAILGVPLGMLAGWLLASWLS